MNLFAKWTEIAHLILVKHYPKIKLNQTRELLSTWVGHKTYASLKMHDLQIINEERGLYIIVSNDDVLERASRLGIDLIFDHWILVHQKLSRSGISRGYWLVWMRSMIHSACNIFEVAHHPEKFNISRQIGTLDGFRNTEIVRTTDLDGYPLQLTVDINSQLLSFNTSESLYFPVHGRVSFERIGARIYAEGQLISLEQTGPSGHYEKTDDDYIEFSGIYD